MGREYGRAITRQAEGGAGVSEFKMLNNLLLVLFIGLKLTGHINWSWWLVLLPFWGWFVVVFFLLLILGYYRLTETPTEKMQRICRQMSEVCKKK